MVAMMVSLLVDATSQRSRGGTKTKSAGPATANEVIYYVNKN